MRSPFDIEGHGHSAGAPARIRFLPAKDRLDRSIEAGDHQHAAAQDALAVAMAGTTYLLSPSTTNATEGTQLTFTITRSGDKPAETIYFSTLSGTASYTAGDYGLTNGGEPKNVAVTFAAGTTSKTVTINILDDGIADSGENFRAIIQHSSGDPASTFLARTDVITINDPAPSTSYSVTSQTSVTEGNQLTFTVTRSGDKPAETLYFSTLSGSASFAEGDYATASGGEPKNIAISFAAGATSKTVTINILNDGVSDSGEDFRAIVQRHSGDSASTFLARSDFVTINDPAQTTNYTLTSVTAVTEGNQLTFTITRSGDKPAETLYFSTLTGSASFTAGDYAMPGGTEPKNIAVSFGLGITSQTVTINILNDGISDSGEDFRAIVQRHSGDSASTFLARSDSVTINDAAGQPVTTDDYRDDPSDGGSYGALGSGGSRTGVIEASGDKDAFTLTVQAGHRYSVVVESAKVGGYAGIAQLAATLRDAGFTQVGNTKIGSGAITFTFDASTSGQMFVRVGSGGSGSDTGGYRITAADKGSTPTPAPTPPPSTDLPPAEAAAVWLSGVVARIEQKDFHYLWSGEAWDSFDVIARKMNDYDAVSFANKVGKILEPLHIAIAGAELIAAVGNSSTPVETLFVEVGNLIAAALFTQSSITAGAIIGSAGGPLGGLAGAIAASVFGSFIYEKAVEPTVKADLASWFESHVGHFDGKEPADNGAWIQSASYGELLVGFDETYYVSHHPDVAAALASGAVGSAYAHFLTIGIDLGYQPNANQTLTRADLVVGLANNDPLALGNAVLFTAPLGTLAGDGASIVESAVAIAAASAAGAAHGTALDAELSALAYRKALDLVANGDGSAVDAAAGKVNSSWASDWSDGAGLDQHFAGEILGLLGTTAASGNFQMFSIAAATTDPQAVLAQFASQTGWNASGAYDTMGIAEYGGIWVIIVADRAATYAVTGPGSDTLAGITEYGTGDADTLYAGSRAGMLYGLDGNDRLYGGTGADHLYGGFGDDSYVVDQQGDLVFENPGEGVDSVVTTASYYLYANIERLYLAAGAGSVFGVGNALDNQLVGNEGDNLLIAGAGNDQAWGGAGSDTLFGQDGADQLVGEAGIDYLIGGNGDDTLFGGDDADGLYGEAGDDSLVGGDDFKTDILVGGDGNDVLFGNSGLGDYDLMDGGAGNDRYLVDTPADLTFEAANGGTDTVYADIKGTGYYLYANVENLVLSGTTPFGVGNELNNALIGNDAANWLLGGAGNDVLNGKAGNDVLFGQDGADTFVFEHGTGGDTIADFTPGTDHIDLSAFGFTSFAQVQAAMSETGGSSAIILGGGDLIVLQGVGNAALHAGDFILSGGSAAQVEPLVRGDPDDVPRGSLIHQFDAPWLMVSAGDLGANLSP